MTAAAARRMFGDARATAAAPPSTPRVDPPVPEPGAGSSKTRHAGVDWSKARPRSGGCRRSRRRWCVARLAARPVARRVVDGRLGGPESNVPSVGALRPTGRRPNPTDAGLSDAYLRSIQARQKPGRCSHGTHCVPSHQRCQVCPSTPRANTSRRSAPPRRRGRRRGRIKLAAERLPLVPVRPVPVAVPQRAVGHDREDLHLALGPGHDGRRRRGARRRGPRPRSTPRKPTRNARDPGRRRPRRGRAGRGPRWWRRAPWRSGLAAGFSCRHGVGRYGIEPRSVGPLGGHGASATTLGGPVADRRIERSSRRCEDPAEPPAPPGCRAGKPRRAARRAISASCRRSCR